MAANPYETDRLLGEYLLFHYGKREEVLPYPFGPVGALDFAVRAVTDCLDFATLTPFGRALDLGCAVGRSSFELARHCEEVVGIDYSAKFVQAADHLRLHGSLPYTRTDEGRLTTRLNAEVPADIDRARLRFDVGDACWLDGGLGRFDVALLINLIDRLKEPRWCLDQLPNLLRSNAQLVIASPFTWLEEYTPFPKWLGGYEENGQPVGTFETVCRILAPDFELIRTVDLPFLIREHARKFQWSVSKAGVWRRR